MTAKNQDFTIYRGDSQKLIFKVEGVDNISNSQSIKWRVVASVSSDEPLIEKQFSDTINVNDEGDIVININPEDTKELELRSFVHELEIIDFEGNVSTASRGKMRIIKPIIEQ